MKFIKNILCRKKGKRLVLFSTMLLLAGAAFFIVYSQAELGIPEGVQISPARFDLDLTSGSEYVGRINLKNYADKPYSVKIEIEDFYVSDDSTEARFFVPDENHPLYAYDVINWIEIDQEVLLAPKEGKDIYYKVKVPEGMPTGGYYGAIFFRTSDSVGEEGLPEEESQITVSQRVGTLLVMAVKGAEPIRRSGELINFYPTKKIFFSPPAELVTEIENNGNLHYKVFGKIDILKFGKNFKTIDFVPRVVYPGKIRQYVRDWDFSAWSFGRYKAKVELLSEDKQIAMKGETIFWVIPWKTTLSIIIILIIIWLILRIFASKFEIRLKKKEEDEKEEEEIDDETKKNETAEKEEEKKGNVKNKEEKESGAEEVEK